eukprot:SAG31_NODE_441_length_15661_cov_17.905423_4_plen_92_part_00
MELCQADVDESVTALCIIMNARFPMPWPVTVAHSKVILNIRCDYNKLSNSKAAISATSFSYPINHVAHGRLAACPTATSCCCWKARAFSSS